MQLGPRAAGIFSKRSARRFSLEMLQSSSGAQLAERVGIADEIVPNLEVTDKSAYNFFGLDLVEVKKPVGKNWTVSFQQQKM
jgi:hypothetical protein